MSDKNVDMGFIDPADFPAEIVWECPVCGTQMATVRPHSLLPSCGAGHKIAEMEQKAPEAWGRGFVEMEEE